MILQVDKVHEFASQTTNIEYIKTNIDKMGWDYSSDVEIQSLLSSNKTTFVNYVGRYICLLQIDSTQTSGRMVFFDHTVINKPKSLTIFAKFEEKVANMLNANYDLISSVFSSDIDVVSLRE